jgi:hypothetical protein
MRAWIVLALIVWVIGAWWTLTAIGLPPQTATKNEACFYLIGTAPNDHAEYVRRCLADPGIEAAGARQLFAMVVGFWFLLPIVPGLVIWLIAMAWKARKRSKSPRHLRSAFGEVSPVVRG